MFSNKKFSPFWFCIVFASSTVCCEAFESRFYEFNSGASSDFENIHRSVKLADKTLTCVGLDQIFLSDSDESADQPFKRNEIGALLASGRRKELLVIWFLKPLMWAGPEKVKATICEFKKFVSMLGYKRVLILGSHSAGVFVLYDSSEIAAENN